MQLFYFSQKVTIALLILLWPVFQVSIALLCMKIKDSRFSSDSFLFRTRNWEDNGEIYDKVFRIRKWKKLLPDGGALTKGGYSKKSLSDTTTQNLEKYIVESCRAEYSHALSILPFWVFGLFAPARIMLYMLIYALLINLPCIIAQRYNRPRVAKVLAKIKERDNRRKQYSEGTEQ